MVTEYINQLTEKTKFYIRPDRFVFVQNDGTTTSEFVPGSRRVFQYVWELTESKQEHNLELSRLINLEVLSEVVNEAENNDKGYTIVKLRGPNPDSTESGLNKNYHLTERGIIIQNKSDPIPFDQIMPINIYMGLTDMETDDAGNLLVPEQYQALAYFTFSSIIQKYSYQELENSGYVAQINDRGKLFINREPFEYVVSNIRYTPLEKRVYIDILGDDYGFYSTET